MTDAQVRRMYIALKEISGYFTPEKLRMVSQKQYGLDYEEALEMAYENIMVTAKEAVKGIRLKRS